MKVRQPAAALYVKGEDLPQDLVALIQDELNVKQVNFVQDVSGFTTYQLKPQMRTLGPRYGKLLGAIGKALSQMDGNAAVARFEAGEA